ncbi:MAG: NUDIX domain-containing protein [Pseudomonadales bacterium]|jgi:8-oxo-dGTP pyrophosphatase MutT (NUDIX family)|nr:NUDIX domain-containing protein [Pseudomonadales bacterium]
MTTHFPDQTGFVPAAEAQMRQAATIVLLRDSRQGPEVFMMERASRLDFGGLHVFPGGKVDPHDAVGEMARHCPGLSDAEASARLGLAEGGLAYWVAAIRECFEEAGLLLAYGPDGAFVRARNARWAEGLRQLRQAVNEGSRTFLDVCQRFDMTLAVERVHAFSHWITPEGPPRRYDTRFFVAEAPADQDGLHDDRELIDSRWIRPAEALAARERGEIQLIYPTHATLAALVDLPSAAAVIDLVASGAHRERVTPDDLLAREGLQPPPGGA